MNEQIAGSLKIREQVEKYLLDKECSPITEQPNQLTTNVDLAETGENIMELLAKTDRQIFDGWPLDDQVHSQGIREDHYIMDKVSRLADLIGERLKATLLGKGESSKFKLILSGCGTSGRIAYLCSQTFNSYIKSKYSCGYDVCEYVIAGDDYALVNSVEAVEDKPDVGAQKLISLLGPDDQCVFIGITCGLSAPFVAGQLDYCLNELENPTGGKIIGCGLIGFNPVQMARRNLTINSRGETFLDLLGRMDGLEQAEPDRYFILNPYIGPEPVTGSSRMKSGTTTKIIIDLTLTRALSLIDYNGQSMNVSDLIGEYERLLDETIYSTENKRTIGSIIDRAANSLRNLSTGGSVNYLSDSERLGFVCCVDASECVPTYGAGKRDIKGFVSATGNGLSMANFRGSFQWDQFVKTCTSTWSENVLKSLEDFRSESCLFVLIDHDDEEENLTHKLEISKLNVEKKLLEQTKCKLVHLNVSFAQKESKIDNPRVEHVQMGQLGVVLNRVSKSVNSYFASCLQEYALKLIVNGISTGAHILIGKTYQNIMIDVRVSNVKLYWRAVGILKRLTNQTDIECESYLLKSIYSGESLDLAEMGNIEHHIEQATGQDMVVPKALVMILTKRSYEDARSLLREYATSVRNCIYKIKNNQ